jgi:arsenate reductase-like glutaredoxin family protein
LRELGLTVDERDLGKQPLSAEELDRLIGPRPVESFLNTRNEEYRARNLRLNPLTRSEALQLMAANPNLIRRPLLLIDNEIVVGFDGPRYRELAGR